MIDRNIQPAVHPIQGVDFIKPERISLGNKIPFYILKAGSQPVIRLEFFFKAGSKYQKKPLQASYTVSQLTEGTKNFTAREIADRMDYFGAFLQGEVEDEFSVITLHCLSKNFKDVWPVLKEVLTCPVFPENELNTALANGKQKLSVNLNKVEFVARREFSASLFGKHPYGKKAELEDYTKLTTQDLKDYYNEFYKAENCVVMASGNFGNEIQEILNNEFVLSEGKSVYPDFKFESISAVQKNIPKEGSVQCGIRMGKVLFNRAHEDFIGMNVVNVLLGGYFGSRLMANIREDKGYTYGIGSALVSYHDTGVFLIATEVGAEVCKDALKEIYKEVELLRIEKVSDEELSLVKNYMLGSFLRNSDGPFAMSDRFKTIHFSGLDYSYYEKYIQKVNSITADEILELCKKYLDTKSFTEIVAGTEI
jgi:zinc protease